MTERTIVTCDKCNEEIAKGVLYLNAVSYGIHLHLSCLTELSAREFIVMADIESKVMRDHDWLNATKAPSYFRLNK